MREFEKQATGSPPITSNVNSRSTTPVIVKEKSHAPPPQLPMPGIMKSNSKATKSIPLGNLVAPASPEITLPVSPGPGSASHLVTVKKRPIRGSSGRRGHESATCPPNGEEDPDTVLGYSAPNPNSIDEAAERGRDDTRMVD
ncbi:hypothetical protein HOY82DRAFT_617857 [Tuber indicum]|nr:hypothetical protein HOY82DRAFT_617857 [Tuber indicum]